ncbi:ACT domain-containing protein [Oryzobacter telluris]|uniref:ACT domain-containing protein n=1 Tax=Oryzobacter telluris TaxID=3149179 RepID=UPI00370D6623
MPRHLMEHPEDVAIVRLPGGEDPGFDWTAGPFASLTRTPDETSIVCLAAAVPAGSRTEGPFRVVEVAGPLAFGAAGIFAEVLQPLVDAQISVLGFSTFDTDWVLVPRDDADAATAAWRRAGMFVTPTSLTGGSR